MGDIATDFYLMSAWQNVISQATSDSRHEEESHTKSDKKSTKNNDRHIPSFDEINAGYYDDENMYIPSLDELKNM